MRICRECRYCDFQEIEEPQVSSVLGDIAAVLLGRWGKSTPDAGDRTMRMDVETAFCRRFQIEKDPVTGGDGGFWRCEAARFFGPCTLDGLGFETPPPPKKGD